MAGAELGALLGWMSTRVLGQYDILVGAATRRDDAVYLVGPNLAGVEQRFGFDPAEFRTWVLLHELTHRAQFTGVPWMRDHFTGLVDQSLVVRRPRPRSALTERDEGRAAEPRRGPRSRCATAASLGLIATPEQRAVIARIGGLMSLLEGHGDVTMTRAAGDRWCPTPSASSASCASGGARANPLSRTVMRLTGVEGKLNQYAAGERFIAAIEAVGRPARRRPRAGAAAGAPPDDGRDPRAGALAGAHGARR